MLECTEGRERAGSVPRPRGTTLRAVVLSTLLVVSAIAGGVTVPVAASSAPADGAGAAATASTVNVTLTINESDGTPAVNDTVEFRNANTGSRTTTATDENGTASVTLTAGDPYEITYEQNATASGSYPDDGTPDFHVLGTRTYDADTTNATTLPDAHQFTITTVDERNNTIANASVYVIERYDGASERVQLGTNATGDLLDPGGDPGVEVAGDVNTHAYPPDDRFVDRYDGYSITSDTHLNLTLRDGVNVTGTLTYANDSAAADTTIAWFGHDGVNEVQHNVTTGTGFYADTITEGVVHEVGVWQRDWFDDAAAYPRDGHADVYSLGTVNRTADAETNYTVPVGHLLNVTVVNASGNPVPNATVVVGHENGSATALASPLDQVALETNASGVMLQEPTGRRGLEVNGTVRVEVRAPDGSGYGDNATTVTVTQDRDLAVVLGGSGGDVTVSGQIQYENGTGVPNASVRVVTPDRSDERWAVANASGHYTVSVAPDTTYKVGVYQVNATTANASFPRDGVADFDFRGPLNVSGSVTRNLTLPDGYAVNVTVVNRSGAAMPNATVRLWDYVDYGMNVHAFAGDSFSVNEQGLLEHAPNGQPGFEIAGDLEIHAVPPSKAYIRDSTNVDVTGLRNVTLALEPAVNVSGTIFLPNGTPATNTTISWERMNGTWHAPHDVTDAQGQYSLRIAANVSYDKQVRPVDHRDEPYVYPRDDVADAVAYQPTRETSDVVRNFTIPHGHPFNVTVVNESGHPIENATVRASHLNGPANARLDGFIHGVPTNAQGLMEHEPNGLPGFEVNGTVSVNVEPPDGTGYEPNGTTVNVTGPTNAKVVLHGSASTVNATGRVTYPNGSAASGVTLRFRPTSDDAQHAQVVTADDGSYAATLTPNASYAVNVWQADLRDANVDAPTELVYPRDGVADFASLGWLNTTSSDETRDYDLAAGSVLNVTVDNDSGAAIENASVVLTDETDGAHGHLYSYLHEDGVPTDAAGRMTHPPNPRPGLEVNGSIDVYVRPPSNTAYTSNGTTVSVTGPESVTLTLRKQYTLSGRWVGPDGTPVGDASGLAGNFSMGVFRPADTDAGGNFSATVPEGTYHVWVLPRDPADDLADAWKRHNVTLDADRDLGNLTVPRGYNASVEVRDRDGRLVDARSAVAGGNDGYKFQFRSGRNLTSQDTEPEPVHDLANGSKPATVRDEWTHDVLGRRTVKVTGQPETFVLTVGRYNGTRVSGTSGVTVVRDLQTTARGQSTQDVLNTTVNVRLFVLNSTTGTQTHVRESFPEGYGLHGTVANVSADGTGSIENVTDEDGALTFDVVGNVTEVRYRVEPNATPSSSVRFGGQFGANATPIVGQDSLPAEVNLSVFAPVNGSVVGDATVSVEYVTRHPAAANATAVEYRVDGGAWQSAGRPLAIATVTATLSDGQHTIDVRLANATGTVAVDSVTVTVDDTAPVVAVAPSRSSNVSTNRPVDLALNRTDAHPDTATLTVENASGGVVHERNVTGELSDGSATVPWNATTDAGTPVASGQYTVRLSATDALGNANETTATVTVDNRRPTVAATALDANASPATAPGGRTVHANETLGVAFTTNGTPGDVANVTVELVAQFTTFRATVSNVSGGDGSWTVVANLSALPDDGNYSVNVSAVDPAANANATTANATVVVDRAAPRLGSTVSRVNDSTGRVNLSVGEPVRYGSVNVTVERPNGSTTQVAMTDAGDHLTGTFAFGGNGTYEVTATARDRAGNRGSDSASANVTAIDTANNATTVRLPSGTFVRFRTTNETSSYVSLTGSDTALAPLPTNLTGVGFLHGQLGDALNASLRNATIGIPVNESKLPDGTSAENATIGFYNETGASWERLNTTTRNVTVGGTTEEYWLANVTHFSTYGAVAADTSPPTLESASPDGDLAYEVTDATVRFEYGDAASGVNVSAVTLALDGTNVTDSAATAITSGYARYRATGLAVGEHEATVTVVDEAGNVETFRTTFTVREDATPPSIVGTTPVDGHEYSAGTSSVTLAVEYADGETDVNASAVSIALDGTAVTPDSVSSSAVSYTATGLADGSTHTLNVTVVDEAGNVRTKSVTFSVAEAGGGSGGGGGGLEPSKSVAIAERVAGGVRVDVVNGQPDAVARTALPAVEGSAISPTGLAVSFAEPAGDFSMRVAPASQRPAGVPALDGATPVGYFTVDAGVADRTVRQATVSFELADGSLPADASLDDVAVFRYHDGAWQRLETSRSGRTFSARTPGFSAFAVAVAHSNVAVTDATLADGELAVGGTASVEVMLSNDGRADGTQQVAVTAGGEVVASREVTVPAREETTVTLSWTPDEAGSYEVAVGDTDAGTLSVEAEGTTTTTTSRSGTTTPDQEDGSGFVLLGALLVVGLALVAGYLRHRRRESDGD
jgi:hypothetical protein